MSQRYLEKKKKRPNLKENQIEILRFFEFCQEFQQRAPGLGDRCYWGYISMRIHLKSCLIFPQKGLQLYLVVQGWSILVTLLRLVSRLHVKTSSPDVHGRKRQNWWSH